MQASAEFGWYNRNCAINPYLIEGKKTVSLELAEQFLRSRPAAFLIGWWFPLAMAARSAAYGRGSRRCTGWACFPACRESLAFRRMAASRS